MSVASNIEKKRTKALRRVLRKYKLNGRIVRNKLFMNEKIGKKNRVCKINKFGSDGIIKIWGTFNKEQTRKTW